jgi:hypothetical protein
MVGVPQSIAGNVTDVWLTGSVQDQGVVRASGAVHRLSLPGRAVMMRVPQVIVGIVFKIANVRSSSSVQSAAIQSNEV